MKEFKDLTTDQLERKLSMDERGLCLGIHQGNLDDEEEIELEREIEALKEEIASRS